jgi:hypothetical protein
MASVQASTGFSPYEMLIGLDPDVPLAEQDWGEEVDFLDDPNEALESWAGRRMRMKDHYVVTRVNLKHTNTYTHCYFFLLTTPPIHPPFSS